MLLLPHGVHLNEEVVEVEVEGLDKEVGVDDDIVLEVEVEIFSKSGNSLVPNFSPCPP